MELACTATMGADDKKGQEGAQRVRGHEKRRMDHAGGARYRKRSAGNQGKWSLFLSVHSLF